MAGMQGGFDATNIPPQQSVGVHPPGMYDFNISHTEIKENNAKTGGYLEVEFSSPVGKAYMRYNLWNPEPKAVEIANKQLSALCHATGIFRLDFGNEAAALRNGRGRMEVGPQKDPQYTEVKRVFDVNGNEPGKAPQVQQQAPVQQQPQGFQQPQSAPMTQQPNGGWGAPAPSQAPANAPPQQAGWGGQAPQTQPAPAQGGGWQQPSQAPVQQQSPPNQPPWATK